MQIEVIESVSKTIGSLALAYPYLRRHLRRLGVAETIDALVTAGQERVRASYRENYDRLAQVKATYDPENFFHVNQNIHPAR